MCIIDNVLLDSGVVRPRGLLFITFSNTAKFFLSLGWPLSHIIVFKVIAVLVVSGN